MGSKILFAQVKTGDEGKSGAKRVAARPQLGIIVFAWPGLPHLPIMAQVEMENLLAATCILYSSNYYPCFTTKYF
jgi:hypothetical protein